MDAKIYHCGGTDTENVSEMEIRCTPQLTKYLVSFSRGYLVDDEP